MTDLDVRHLKVKEERYKDITKFRSEVLRGIRKYFDSFGYTEVTIPIFTRSISSPGALNKMIPSDVNPFKVDYFGNEIFLSQSSQFYLEALMYGLDKVYTIMPSFRNEKSDVRHLTEFWHAEVEAQDTDFEGIMKLQEDFVCNLCEHVSENCGAIIDRFDPNSNVYRVKKPFKRIRYDEAVKILEERGFEIDFSSDISDLGHFGRKEEIELVKGETSPIFVTHYPTNEVAFYHKMDPDDISRTLNADLLAPSYGEIAGSGERITSTEELIRKMDMFKINKDDYNWYLDMRKYNDPSTPHAGFGLGVDRFTQWALGLDDISDSVVFPRVDYKIFP
jgi:asparaginyl-tRNA synthetase